MILRKRLSVTSDHQVKHPLLLQADEKKWNTRESFTEIVLLKGVWSVTKNHTNLLPFNAKSDITFWWNIQVLTSGSYVWCVLHAMGDLEYCQMLKEKPEFRGNYIVILGTK